MAGITARISVPRDVTSVEVLVRQANKSDINSSELLGSALLNLTAVDEKDTVVGYLCLDDEPCARVGQLGGAAEAWVQEAAGRQRFRLGSSAFVRVCATMHLYEVEATSAMLRAAFSLIPSLQALFMASTADLSFTEPGLASVFSRVTASKEAGAVLYETQRLSVLPPLVVRPGRVEDHDDMLPILQRCEQSFPALAKLPESSRPQEPFALTRVVAGQDERNRVLVAEAEGKLVGFMVMTADVDTSSLAEAFDLHAFDNFLPQEAYEVQYQTAREAVRSKKLSVLQAEAARRRAEAGVEDEPQASAEASAMDVVDASAATDAGADGEVNGEKAERRAAEAETKAASAEQEAQELAAAAEPSEEEVRAEMLVLYGGGPTDAEPTLFAITMLCMDPVYETQAPEFLGPAFGAFPEKLYAVVTLPHDSPEPALMDTLTRVAPLPGSLFPEVLFMFNRHALLADFEVRLGAADDHSLVEQLVAGMPNAADISSCFVGSAQAGTAVVALCRGELIGLCTVNPDVDLELLQANFALASHVDLGYQPKALHGEIDMYTMNPIFVHRHRPFLAAAMRILGKAALYYALPPGQQPPDMQDVLEQVAPRHRAGDKQLQADFALYTFTRQAAFKRRRSVNSQIVIAGSSECGLAVLERLLLDRELQFNYLTLLAPGGIRVGGMACQYTAGVIARLGLEARVLLLDAEMVGLDRSARLVELSDGSQLSYNALVVAAGLQDQSRYSFAEADPEVAGLLVTELELAADFSMNDAMVMNSILVYGNALGAYHALSVLENKGASSKVRFVAPPGQEPPLVGLMVALAGEAGVSLPQPERREVASLLAAGPAAQDLRATATLVDPDDPGPREELQVDLVVGCEPPGASRSLFDCLNDSSLVFDGRLVVDGAFRTNDPHIYAGGTLAKLSRRYGGVHLEHYNSRDVGGRVAASLVTHFTAPPDRPSSTGPPPPPVLQRGRTVGCMLPGGMHFAYAGCPQAMAAPSLHAPPDGLELGTKTDRGLMRLLLDHDGIVHAVMYVGRVAVSAPRLGALVGLQANYLNQLVPRFKAGQINDLLTYLTDSWAEILYNDSFPQLRAQLIEVALASASVAGADVKGGMVELVTSAQDAVLEFARVHAAELPGYELPSAARAKK